MRPRQVERTDGNEGLALPQQFVHPLYHAAVAVDDEPLLEAADGSGRIIALLGIQEAVHGHQVAGEIGIPQAGEHALDLVSKMEESQRFHDTYIEEETTQEGNGDTVQLHITALYIPDPGSPAPATTPRPRGTP